MMSPLCLLFESRIFSFSGFLNWYDLTPDIVDLCFLYDTRSCLFLYKETKYFESLTTNPSLIVRDRAEVRRGACGKKRRTKKMAHR